MQKRMTAVCLVIIAFAAAPSFATANPIFTEPTGTALKVGATVTATNVGAYNFETSTGTLSCTTGHLHGKVSANTTATGGQVEITGGSIGGTGAKQEGAAANECTGSSFFTPNTTYTPQITMPWCMSASSAADAFTLRGGGCAEASRAIKFNLDVTGVGTCEYSREASANGTLVTHGGGANENTMALTNQAWTRIGGPVFCPSEGKMTIRLSWETTDGTKIFESS
jgi:hypothetical protein